MQLSKQQSKNATVIIKNTQFLINREIQPTSNHQSQLNLTNQEKYLAMIKEKEYISNWERTNEHLLTKEKVRNNAELKKTKSVLNLLKSTKQDLLSIKTPLSKRLQALCNSEEEENKIIFLNNLNIETKSFNFKVFENRTKSIIDNEFKIHSSNTNTKGSDNDNVNCNKYYIGSSSSKSNYQFLKKISNEDNDNDSGRKLVEDEYNSLIGNTNTNNFNDVMNDFFNIEDEEEENYYNNIEFNNDNNDNNDNNNNDDEEDGYLIYKNNNKIIQDKERLAKIRNTYRYNFVSSKANNNSNSNKNSNDIKLPIKHKNLTVNNKIKTTYLNNTNNINNANKLVSSNSTKSINDVSLLQSNSLSPRKVSFKKDITQDIKENITPTTHTSFKILDIPKLSPIKTEKIERTDKKKDSVASNNNNHANSNSNTNTALNSSVVKRKRISSLNKSSNAIIYDNLVISLEYFEDRKTERYHSIIKEKIIKESFINARANQIKSEIKELEEKKKTYSQQISVQLASLNDKKLEIEAMTIKIKASYKRHKYILDKETEHLQNKPSYGSRAVIARIKEETSYINELESKLEYYKNQKEELSLKMTTLKNQRESIKNFDDMTYDYKQVLGKIIDEQKNYYLEILRIGYDCRNKGLRWVVVKLKSLRTDLCFKHFPRYLTHDQINFILSISEKDYLRDVINIKLKELKTKLKKETDCTFSRRNGLVNKDISELGLLGLISNRSNVNFLKEAVEETMVNERDNKEYESYYKDRNKPNKYINNKNNDNNNNMMIKSSSSSVNINTLNKRLGNNSLLKESNTNSKRLNSILKNKQDSEVNDSSNINTSNVNTYYNTGLNFGNKFSPNKLVQQYSLPSLINNKENNNNSNFQKVSNNPLLTRNKKFKTTLVHFNNNNNTIFNNSQSTNNTEKIKSNFILLENNTSTNNSNILNTINNSSRCYTNTKTDRLNNDMLSEFNLMDKNQSKFKSQILPKNEDILIRKGISALNKDFLLDLHYPTNNSTKELIVDKVIHNSNNSDNTNNTNNENDNKDNKDYKDYNKVTNTNTNNKADDKKSKIKIIQIPKLEESSNYLNTNYTQYRDNNNKTNKKNYTMKYFPQIDLTTDNFNFENNTTNQESNNINESFDSLEPLPFTKTRADYYYNSNNSNPININNSNINNSLTHNYLLDKQQQKLLKEKISNQKQKHDLVSNANKTNTNNTYNTNSNISIGQTKFNASKLNVILNSNSSSNFNLHSKSSKDQKPIPRFINNITKEQDYIDRVSKQLLKEILIAQRIKEEVVSVSPKKFTHAYTGNQEIIIEVDDDKEKVEINNFVDKEIYSLNGVIYSIDELKEMFSAKKLNKKTNMNKYKRIKLVKKISQSRNTNSNFNSSNFNSNSNSNDFNNKENSKKKVLSNNMIKVNNNSSNVISTINNNGNTHTNTNTNTNSNDINHTMTNSINSLSDFNNLNDITSLTIEQQEKIILNDLNKLDSQNQSEQFKTIMILRNLIEYYNKEIDNMTQNYLRKFKKEFEYMIQSPFQKKRIEYDLIRSALFGNNMNVNLNFDEESYDLLKKKKNKVKRKGV